MKNYSIRRKVYKKHNILGVKLNSRCFIRDGGTSIIFTEVILKLYWVDVVDIKYPVFESEFTCEHNILSENYICDNVQRLV